MSLTATLVKRNKNPNYAVHIYDVQFDSAYPTGGEAVTASTFALTTLYGCHIVDTLANATHNRFVTYNPTTHKLVVWTNVGTQATGEVSATATLTSDNTELTDGDTVTINDVTYRFKNTPALVNDVKRHGTVADTTLGNLVKAVNQSGLGDGTDYFAGTVAPTGVTAAAVASHATVLTATAGAAGNSFASTETSSHLSFGGLTFSGGSDGSDQSNVVVRVMAWGELYGR